MLINLIDLKPDKRYSIYRDWAGGFGTCFEVSSGPLLNLLELAKYYSINLPIPVFGYINALFVKYGHTVKLHTNGFDADADLIIIHSSIIMHKAEIEFAKNIKASQTKARVCFIGPFSHAKPDLFMQAANLIIKGEPEAVIEEIAKSKIIPEGVAEKELADLNALPFPDWSIYDNKNFRYFPNIVERPVFPVSGSRGCVYKCNYCPYLVNYSKFKARSAENIYQEIEYLKKTYNAKGVIFRDPLFTASINNSRNFAELLIRNNTQIKWACETHLQHLNHELLDLFKVSGLCSINVGIESFDQYAFNGTERLFDDRRHQEDIIAYCDKIGIKISAFYLFGLNDDTEESISSTIDYAIKLNTNTATFNIATPYPGTRFYEQSKDRIIEKDFSRYTSYNPILATKTLGLEALKKLQKKAYNKYYFRLGYIIKLLTNILRSVF